MKLNDLELVRKVKVEVSISAIKIESRFLFRLKESEKDEHGATERKNKKERNMRIKL